MITPNPPTFSAQSLSCHASTTHQYLFSVLGPKLQASSRCAHDRPVTHSTMADLPADQPPSPPVGPAPAHPLPHPPPPPAKAAAVDAATHLAAM